MWTSDRNRWDQVARDDPPGHALHVAAAMAWCFLQAIANTPEAIAWGVLLCISLFRLGRTAALYGPILRDPVWLLFVGWWLWSLATLLWSVDGVDVARQLRPERALLTPLLLWPVAHLAWPLLAALAAGAAVQTVAVLIWSLWPLASGDPVRTYAAMRGLMSFNQMGWYLQIAAVVPLAALASGSGRSRAALLPIPLAAAIAILLSGMRSVIANLVAGLLVLTTRPRRPGTLARAAIAVVFFGIALLSVHWLAPQAITRATAGAGRVISWISASHGEGSPTRSEILSMASDRVGLLVAASDMIRGEPGNGPVAAPLVGNGRGSFPPLLSEWIDREERSDPEFAALAARLRDNRHPHNLYALAWLEGGLPQLALASLAIWALAVRLWKGARADPALAAMAAIYAAVLVSTFVGIVETKAPGAIVALAIVFSRIPAEPPRA